MICELRSFLLIELRTCTRAYLVARDAVQIDAVQQHHQVRLLHRLAAIDCSSLTGTLNAPLSNRLYQSRATVAIEYRIFNGLLPVAEDETVTGERIVLQELGDHRRQPSKS